MQLISYETAAFLAAGLLLYYTAGRHLHCQPAVLLLMSLGFYVSHGLRFLCFPAAVLACAYWGGLFFGRLADAEKSLKQSRELTKEERKSRKQMLENRKHRMLFLCLLFSFGILGILKYTDFLLSLIGMLLNAAGIEGCFEPLHFLLPLGISYYTFQGMGYLIDVRRGKYPPEKNIFRLALFLLFFPQLISGPISRYPDIAPGLFGEHRPDPAAMAAGIRRILFGALKKLVIADRMAGPVMAFVSAPSSYSGMAVLFGILGYTLWMYADFSGCMDIVLGIAGLFSVRLPENFNRPFLSKSLSEFWTRWHMTLMQWMRDYVFYPAATSKRGRRIAAFFRGKLPFGLADRLPIHLASFTVWLITGLWHGASMRFFLWGMANFLVMAVSQELEPLYRRVRNAYPRLSASRAYTAFRIVRTFLLFTLIEMFEYLPGGAILPTLRSIFGTGGISLGALLSDTGIRRPELLVLSAAWILVLLSGLLPGAFPFSSGAGEGPEENGRTDRPFVRYLLYFLLFVFVLLTGTYGRGYVVQDFFYNSF